MSPVASIAARDGAVRGELPNNSFFFARPARILILIGFYFALQVLIRVLLSPSTDLDESEQFILTQKLSLGYGSNPPLYTWLQEVFFVVCGRSVLGLALLKNLLLFGTFGFTFLSVRLITSNGLAAMAAALSLFLIPEVVWESQRDLTHSVLSATLACATLFCFLKAHQARSPRWFLAVGLCLALGTLSKYNYLFWAVGMLAGALFSPEYRRTVLDKRMSFGALLAVVVMLPHLLWLRDHHQEMLMTSGKLKMGPDSAAISILLGLKNLAQAIAAFIGPLCVFFVLVFFKSFRSNPPPLLGNSSVRMLGRVYGAILVLLVLLIIIFRATGMRERYLQPILMNIPVLAAAALAARLTVFRVKCFLGFALLIMLGVAIGIPARVIYAEKFNREQVIDLPFRELAANLQRELPLDSEIVTDTQLLGGNLSHFLPGTRIATPVLADLFVSKSQHLFVSWDARKTSTPPEVLVSWLKASGRLPAPDAAIRFYSASSYHWSSRRMRIGLLQVK